MAFSSSSSSSSSSFKYVTPSSSKQPSFSTFHDTRPPPFLSQDTSFSSLSHPLNSKMNSLNPLQASFPSSGLPPPHDSFHASTSSFTTCSSSTTPSSTLLLPTPRSSTPTSTSTSSTFASSTYPVHPNPPPCSFSTLTENVACSQLLTPSSSTSSLSHPPSTSNARPFSSPFHLSLDAHRLVLRLKELDTWITQLEQKVSHLHSLHDAWLSFPPPPPPPPPSSSTTLTTKMSSEDSRSSTSKPKKEKKKLPQHTMKPKPKKNKHSRRHRFTKPSTTPKKVLTSKKHTHPSSFSTTQHPHASPSLFSPFPPPPSLVSTSSNSTPLPYPLSFDDMDVPVCFDASSYPNEMAKKKHAFQ
ncbi:hypothetical protein HMI54_015509 [Coelomomyces lativittatus]|nr:hypothetical protein HMI56_004460 [Coelomomyces lativittatus]KAJ1500623.1 hypothetical protein HMI55_003801 [Coelomomyces lativittatus]KAJ1512749.1 hypothetical protein HMI54_015509 [Coelomomyces lativittatus]